MLAVDSAGSMTIHMFGAYFGLTCAFYYKPRRAIADEFEQGAHNYNSRLISMIGTLFLFTYWPSFNSALSVGVAQQRAAVNTFFAITASALTAGFMSRLVKGGRFDMEIIMNATLAGGVMIAASVEMIFNPGFAIIVGCFAGIASSLAFTKLTPFMESKVRIHDTCGVQFLHGIPGQLGAVTSAIAAGVAIYNYDNEF
jgi:ammonium transporter Rh